MIVIVIIIFITIIIVIIITVIIVFIINSKTIVRFFLHSFGLIFVCSSSVFLFHKVEGQVDLHQDHRQEDPQEVDPQEVDPQEDVLDPQEDALDPQADALDPQGDVLDPQQANHQVKFLLFLFWEVGITVEIPI